MQPTSFKVVKGSKLINMSFGEASKMYRTRITGYKIDDGTELFPAFQSKIIKEGYTLTVIGGDVYRMFAVGTEHYEIDA